MGGGEDTLPSDPFSSSNTSLPPPHTLWFRPQTRTWTGGDGTIFSVEHLMVQKVNVTVDDVSPLISYSPREAWYDGDARDGRWKS